MGRKEFSKEKESRRQTEGSGKQDAFSNQQTEFPMLQVDNLSVSYGDYKVLDDLSFCAQPGQWVMIVGPNGAGKSTTLEAISQTSAYTGRILLGGQDAASMKAQERARFVGVLAQNHYVGYGFTVEEVVRLGRYSHGKGLLAGRGDGDDEAVEKALAQTGMEEKRSQSVLTLSGGELQRVFLAQVMAQNPSLLLLDEPTNHLDLVYQKQIFGLISDWLKEPGRTVVSVVHDLSLAKAFGTHAVLIDGGRCVAQGSVDEVLTPAHLNDIYHMDVPAWMRQMLEQWV